MKKILLLLIFCFFYFKGIAQCPPSPVLIQSQTGLDSFQVLYPNCTEYEGLILIENVTNLNGLSQLTRVENIQIQVADGLTSLAGLENVEYLGTLGLTGTGITNLNALTSLTSMNSIRLSSVSAMNDISALQNINGDMDGISLNNLPLLPNLNGLQGITSLNSLELTRLGLLTNIDELANVTIINDNLILTFLDNLVSLETTFQNITMQSTAGVIRIEHNDLLTSIGNLIENIIGPFTVKVQYNDSLSTIAGLSGTTGIEEIGDLWIQGNDILTNLEGLESVNTINNTMYIVNNGQLQSISQLQNINFINGEDFRPYTISSNPLLTSIDGLFAPNTFLNGRGLRIAYNTSLENLNGCENIIGLDGGLAIIGNDLVTTLDPLQNITGELTYLIVSDNELVATLDPLAGITGAAAITISNMPLLTDLDGLENIVMVPENINFVTNELTINDNTSLNDISAIAALGMIPFDANLVMEITNNPLLSFCNVQSVCEELAFEGVAEILIENNAVGCESEFAVEFACNLDINLISGVVQFDFDNDGCDTGDYLVSSILLESTDGTDMYATFSNTDGSYNNYLDIDGSITTTIPPASLPPFYTVSPGSVTTNFVGFGNQVVEDFCLTAPQNVDDLKISLIPTSQVIPGFDSTYTIVYENIGSTVLDADVVFTFDDIRQIFLSAIPAPTTVAGNTITWSLANIPPFASGEIEIVQNNVAPPVNEIDDMVCTSASIEYTGVEDDASPLNNSTLLKQIYIGSYDPNDKQVTQGAEISEEEVGEYLDYIVRFQNTGTADALTVKVTDTLDTNLNWATLRPISASHAYTAEIRDGNALTFTFENINLPPESSDPEGSQGFVAFQIKTLETLQLNDFVENTANIFFDFNEPIITNTTRTTIIDAVAPSAVCESIAVVLDEFGEVTITASDIDGGSTDANGIASVAIDINTFDCTNLGDNDVTLTVTDTSGNESSCVAIVTVTDEAAPVFDPTTLPNNEIRLADLSDIYLLEDFTTDVIVTDNCNTIFEISQDPEIGTSLSPGAYTIRLATTDASLNEVSYDFELTVEAFLKVAEFSLENAITIFPNPVSDVLNIKTSEGISVENIIVYSVLGHQVKTTSEATLDISNFSEGIYFVKIKTNRGNITKKIVIE